VRYPLLTIGMQFMRQFHTTMTGVQHASGQFVTTLGTK